MNISVPPASFRFSGYKKPEDMGVRAYNFLKKMQASVTPTPEQRKAQREMIEKFRRESGQDNIDLGGRFSDLRVTDTEDGGG